MLLILNIVFGALVLASSVCGIIILIAAFQESVGKGLLCLCVPFYVLYFAFAEFEPSSRKELILGLWLSPGPLAILLGFIS